MVKRITVLIVNFNSSEFVLNTLYCLERITKNPYTVFIADNNSERPDYELLRNGVKGYDNTTLIRKEDFSLTGSMAHGTTLNELLEYVDTPYFSVLDADATFLMRDWDEYLISALDDRSPVIGTQASPQKPRDFPLMFAILFRTKEFKELGIDLRPKDTANFQDTGWELREKYLDAGYRGKLIEMKNTRDYREGPFRDLHGVAEFYLPGIPDRIFASHFGRGSSLGRNKYLRTDRLHERFIFKMPFIGDSFLRRRGLAEKRTWIHICRSIVENQVKEARGKPI